MRDKAVLPRRSNDYTTGRGALITLGNVGRLQKQLGLIEAASRTNQECLELSRVLATSNPDVPLYANRRFTFASNAGDVLWAKKRWTEAIASYREALEVARSPAFARMPQWPQAALIAARLASPPEKEPDADKNTSDSAARSDDPESERMADLAIEALRKAIESELLSNPDWMRRSTLLKHLQDRVDFRVLLSKLEVNSPSGAEMPNGHWAFAGLEVPGKTAATRAEIASPIDRAIQLRADVAAAHHAIGVVRLRFEQWDAAESLLTQALEERMSLLADDPDTPDHRFDLAMSHLQLGDLACDRDWMPEALSHWLKGRDELVALLDELPNDHLLVPEVARTLDALAWPLWGYFLTGESQATVERSRNLTPHDNDHAYLFDGLHGLVDEDPALYRSTCRAVVDHYRTTENGHYAANIAMLCALGPDSGIDPAEFIAFGELGVKNSDPSADQWRLAYLSVSYYRAGRYDDALRVIDESVRGFAFGVNGSDETTAYAMVVRAMCLQRLLRFEEARRALAQARKWRSLLVYLNMSRPISAGGKSNPVLLMMIGISLSEAAALIEGGGPKPDPCYHILEAWSEVQFGRLDRARAVIERLSPSAQVDPDVLASRALVLHALGERDRAQAALEAALRIDPDHLLARYVRGRLAIEQGGSESATDDLVRVLARLPESWEVNSARYPVDMLMARSDAVFARAVALRPNDLNLWIARGRYLAWHERWREAADAYSHAIPSLPIDYDWLEYAAVLVLAGDLARYDRLSEQVEATIAGIESDPRLDNPKYRTMTATRILGLDPRTDRESTREPNSVERALLKVPADQKNYYFGRYTMAATLERTGGADRAVQLATASLGDLPLWASRELDWYVLALAHQRLGNRADALRWLDRAERRFLQKQQVARRFMAPPFSFYQCDDLEERILRRRAQEVILDAVFPEDPFAHSH